MSTTTDKMTDALAALSHAPKLIVTDSQVFGYVYEHKPAESMLTSFSVLFAAYKGDLPYYVESARAIDALKPSSRGAYRRVLYTCASCRGYRQGEASEPASKACR